jgi:hypothetical protein
MRFIQVRRFTFSVGVVVGALIMLLRRFVRPVVLGVRLGLGVLLITVRIFSVLGV